MSVLCLDKEVKEINREIEFTLKGDYIFWEPCTCHFFEEMKNAITKGKLSVPFIKRNVANPDKSYLILFDPKLLV